LLFLIVCSIAFSNGILAQSALNPGFAESDSRYSPSARAGREIWFNATAFNDRFYTYAYPQRLGATIDWYLILGAKNKNDLYQGWGAVPDPDCCVPGDPDCSKKSLDETYGFQWCPGDDELLKFVGKEGYRDPACNFVDGPFNESTPHGKIDQRQNSCDLRFGTSTGALGLRKFPNPRFDAKKWESLNGSLASWEGYRKFLSNDGTNPDSQTNRLFDGSIEPPFRIGMACGACHISYNPLKPPANPNNPKWENIDGLVGNQFSRVSQMLASGMSPHQYEWQLIALSRPGTVDTSALPMDTVANPSTMNAIMNLRQRPLHEHRVLKWRKASSCPPATTNACWCEPSKPGKCWERSERVEMVPNILKGGEDSIGVNEAVQRVYFNIGSCAEQCWLNHIPDLRAIDPAQRNYGQTPLDVGQCRRDCASFRAIEDRLDDVVAFLATSQPADLWKARGLSNADELVSVLDSEFGPGAVALGRQVFTRACAGCHSSQKPPHRDTDFHAVDPNDPNDPKARIDFLTTDKPMLAGRIGTYPGRALHSNHMQSRVWEQFAARDLFERPADPARNEIMKGGGRGYYRPTSLLSVWAYAPFMHNNAIGPEICGKPSNALIDFYYSPYVEQDANSILKPVKNPPSCWPFDPSVEGRWKLFKASMEELLHPDRRISKMFITNDDVIVEIAPKLKIGGFEIGGLSLRIPKGFPAVMLNSLRTKDLIQDILLTKDGPEKLEAKYKTLLTPAQFKELSDELHRLRKMLESHPDNFVLDLDVIERGFIQKYYSNLLSRVENTGHRFGESLSDREKQALIAFLGTL